VFLEERKVGNLKDQLVLLGFGIHPPQRPESLVPVRSRSGKLELLDLIFDELPQELSGRARSMRTLPP